MIAFVQRIVCMLYLANIIGFQNAVLYLYYQTFKLKNLKKVKSYSAQFKIVSTKNPSQKSNKQVKATKKTLTKDRQEFINNISASGFKQFYEIYLYKV